MLLRQLHDWNLTIPAAKELQNRLAYDVCRTGSVVEPCFIAGVDVSVQRFRGTGTAAVVILSYPALQLVEMQTVLGDIIFRMFPVC